MQYRKTSSHSNLTDSIVSDIRLMNLRKQTTSQISKDTGVHRKTVYNILEGNTWTHVPSPVRARGYPDYLVFPDGRVYGLNSDKFISESAHVNGEKVVRITNSGGKRVTTPVSTLIARGYLGSRAVKPNVKYVDGDPSNSHFTNITL